MCACGGMQASAEREELSVPNYNASLLERLRRWEMISGKTLEEAEAEKDADSDVPAVADMGIQVGQQMTTARPECFPTKSAISKKKAAKIGKVYINKTGNTMGNCLMRFCHSMRVMGANDHSCCCLNGLGCSVASTAAGHLQPITLTSCLQ